MQTVKLFVALQVYLPEQEFPRTNNVILPQVVLGLGPGSQALWICKWDQFSLSNMESHTGQNLSVELGIELGMRDMGSVNKGMCKIISRRLE